MGRAATGTGCGATTGRRNSASARSTHARAPSAAKPPRALRPFAALLDLPAATVDRGADQQGSRPLEGQIKLGAGADRSIDDHGRVVAPRRSHEGIGTVERGPIAAPTAAGHPRGQCGDDLGCLGQPPQADEGLDEVAPPAAAAGVCSSVPRLK